MFHALHCLQMLRIVVRENPSMKVMWSKADQERQGGVVEGEERPAPMDPVHLGHCIGYIAQVGSHSVYRKQESKSKILEH